MAPWSTDIKSFESGDINSERSEQRPLEHGVGGRDSFGAWQTDGKRCNDAELWSEAVTDPL
jgi:hypothetical protein